MRTSIPPDAMGFRLLRERWRAMPEIPVPVPTAEQAAALCESLEADFARFLNEPGAREFVRGESERRLRELIEWTVGRRSWTP